MEIRRKGGIYLWVVVTGILLSYIFSNMLVAGRFNFERFLAQGQVYEQREKSLRQSSATWQYNEEEDCYTIVGDDAEKWYGRWNEPVLWKCLYIRLDKLNRDSVDLVFKEMDGENNYIGQQIITVRNGENWIALTNGAMFQRFKMQIVSGDQVQFRIRELKLSEEVPHRKKTAVFFAGILLCYFAAVFLLQKKWRILDKIRTWERNLCGAVIGFLQFVYRMFGNTLGKSWGGVLTDRQKNRIRTGIFAALFVYMLFVYDSGIYIKKDFYKLHALLASAALLVMALVSWERELLEKKWDRPVYRMWLLFWITVCISDFAVSKLFAFTGYTMLLVGGLFFLVWQHMEKPQEMIWNIMRAMELLFLPQMLYLALFRQKYDGILYNGFLKSSKEFCLYSLFLLMIFAVELFRCIRHRKAGAWLLFCLLGLTVNFYYILLTDQAPGIIFAIGIGVWLCRVLLTQERDWLKQNYKRLALLLAVAAVITGLYHIALKQLPQAVNPVQYEGEQYVSHKSEEIVQQLQATGLSVYQDLKTEDYDQKWKIFKAYFREMNLLGHDKTALFVWNAKRNAGSHILQIMYRYGVIAALFYIAMFAALGFELAAEYGKKKWKLSGREWFCVGAYILWVVPGLFWHAESPYLQPLWLTVYLMFGLC